MALLPLPLRPTIKLTFSFNVISSTYLLILHCIILDTFGTFGLVLVQLFCRFSSSSPRVVFHASRNMNRWCI
ncbi:hypothetical protein ALC62_03366 [Cyphomyrmex costatus]|uniref:Uncharacterized protein n=1 Tax=Cyphomyrmex costatus TaxID=456900 RepID=A0A195CYJ6_9HYME|nr:hypothetical protein ALC62_03366 [Cyphomyrmex costatus]